MARRYSTAADRRRIVRGCLIGGGVGCLAVVLLAVLWAGLRYRRYTAPAPVPPEASLPTPPEVASAPPPPPLQQQLQQVRVAVRSGIPWRVQLDVRPEDLALQVSQQAARRGVRDLRFYFGEGTVVAQGKITFRGRQLDATLRVRPTLVDGRLHVEIEDAMVGQAPLPARLREEWQRQLERALAQNPPEKTHLRLESLQVQPGRILISGQTLVR